METTSSIAPMLVSCICSPDGRARTGVRDVKRMTQVQMDDWASSWLDGGVLTSVDLEEQVRAVLPKLHVKQAKNFRLEDRERCDQVACSVLRQTWPTVWQVIGDYSPDQIGMLWSYTDPHRFPFAHRIGRQAAELRDHVYHRVSVMSLSDMHSVGAIVGKRARRVGAFSASRLWGFRWSTKNKTAIALDLILNHGGAL